MLLSPLVRTPFVNDAVSMTFGVGSVSIGTDPDAVTLVGFTPAIELRKSIGPWVSLSLLGQGIVVGATSQETALVVTEIANYLVQPGELVRLIKTDMHMLAVAFDAGFGGTYVLSPATALQTTLDTGKISLKQLIVKESQVVWSPGLRYGLGAFDMLGFTTEVRTDITTSKPEGKDSSSDASLHLGGALSFDLNPRTGIPIGVVGGYAHDFAFAKGSSDTTAVSAGLFETTSRHVNFGAEFETTFGDARHDYVGMLTLRYYY
jgi:hypothetical protein